LPGITQPDAKLLSGIAAYRRYPYSRDLPDPPVIWAEGNTRLLDYGFGAGTPLFVVPSLVNRAYVLDLMEGHSMLRYLAARGVRPLLLDWGWPGEIERQFTLTDYIVGRLERALMSLNEKMDVAGYCMGGMMALACATRRPDLIRRLCLLATPWDFHGADEQGARKVAGLLPFFEPALGFADAMPVDALQILFSLLDPGSVAAKYRDFADSNFATPRAKLFVALEDWLNDGIPLAASVARETIKQWYGENTPAMGNWRIAGLPVRPETLKMRTFVAVPGNDRIVPPQSAGPLAEIIPGATLHAPSVGHVGMVAGSKARAVLWDVLVNWLEEVT